MSPFIESFQKQLGKRLAQLVLFILTGVCLVAGLQIDLDKHWARIILFIVAGLGALLLVYGLYSSYREKRKKEDYKKPLGIYNSRSFDSERPGGENALSTKQIAGTRQTMEEKAPTPQEPQVEIQEIGQRILLFLAKKRFMTTEDIAKQLQVGPQFARSHLDKLEDAQMIWADPITYGTPLRWQLMRPGRDYLVERGLLS